MEKAFRKLDWSRETTHGKKLDAVLLWISLTSLFHDDEYIKMISGGLSWSINMETISFDTVTINLWIQTGLKRIDLSHSFLTRNSFGDQNWNEVVQIVVYIRQYTVVYG